MASEHCAHGLRADEECEDCRQCLFDEHGWPQDWREARAWQAFRDWLNGTPDEWRGAVSRAWLSGRDYGREDVR